MLKKKEWLRRFKRFVIASGKFNAYDIQEMVKVADEGWGKELSPGEAANECIEFRGDCIDLLRICGFTVNVMG